MLQSGENQNAAARLGRADRECYGKPGGLCGRGIARARFQPGRVDTSAARTPLGEAALQWLLGGFESDAGMRQRVAPAAAPAPAPITDAAARREIVEKVTLTYLGPIASLICDEAFAASDDLDKVLQQIGSNLATPEESRRFMQEVRAALAR